MSWAISESRRRNLKTQQMCRDYWGMESIEQLPLAEQDRAQLLLVVGRARELLEECFDVFFRGDPNRPIPPDLCDRLGQMVRALEEPDDRP